VRLTFRPWDTIHKAPAGWPALLSVSLTGPIVWAVVPVSREDANWVVEDAVDA